MFEPSVVGLDRVVGNDRNRDEGTDDAGQDLHDQVNRGPQEDLRCVVSSITASGTDPSCPDLHGPGPARRPPYRE
jgi:hypothetical protein